MHVRFFAQAFQLPKSGNTLEEYEDAFWAERPIVDHELDLPQFRIAVADGATETSFSRLWAQILVRSYADGRLDAEDFAQSLPVLRRRWGRLVGRKQLPWYAEEKARRGAAAAFVGLHLLGEQDASTGTWSATAVGDSCLFQIRDNKVLECFPVKNATDFSNHPYLVLSVSSASEAWAPHLQTACGSWLAEDSFYLMTDALAAWFLTEREADHAPWAILRDLGTCDAPGFSNWVSELRASRSIRNDDITLVRIDLVG